jgi:hypothetical protein
MPAAPLPLGTLQVDVDDLWVYYESIGLATPAGTQALAFTEGMPRLLDLFDRFGVHATFFVCGRDVAGRGPQHAAVREAIRRGHEIANHSAEHRNGYARLAPAALRADVLGAHERIAEAAGVAPVGFKAPGFSYNPGLPELLAELGYRYDSSILPTPYAPAIRALQRSLSRGEVDATHYGRPSYGLAPLRPYTLDPARPHRKRGGGGLIEAPVTTVPLLRLPMHSTFAMRAGPWLFDLGIGLARLRGLPVNYLLHAADVVDGSPDPALGSYGFLSQSWSQKQAPYERMLAELASHWRLVPTLEFVTAALRTGRREMW